MPIDEQLPQPPQPNPPTFQPNNKALLRRIAQLERVVFAKPKPSYDGFPLGHTTWCRKNHTSGPCSMKES